MKKKGVLKWIVFLPVAVILLTGCEKTDDKVPFNGILPPMIGEEGGMVSGYEGEVVLVIPPGALNEAVRFTIHDLTFKSTQSGNELLKTFIIDPFVNFNVPAKLTVYTDGCLSNGSTVCDEMDVFFFIYGNLADYCIQNGDYCTTCCYEATSHSVSACIEKTGVIETVGKLRQ
jgi:hypothetical protein